MDPEHIELDPDGDVVLILYEQQNECQTNKSESPQGSQIREGESPKGSQTKESESPEERRTKESGSSENSANALSDRKQYRLKVSSKHLSLASTVFQSMLTGDFGEATQLRTTGTTEISLPEDHPEAMRILLSIIHGRTSQIPRNVKIEMLFDTFTLIDKYQLDEAAKFVLDTWVNRLTSQIPRNMTGYPTLMCIYWVLGKQPELNNMLKCVIKECTKPLDLNEMPVQVEDPSSLLDMVNHRREEAFKVFLSSLQSLVQHKIYRIKCQRGKPECEAMVAGGLFRQLNGVGLLPIPRNALENSRLQDMLRHLGDINVPRFCNFRGGCTNWERVQQHLTDLKRKIEEYVDATNLEIV